MALADRSPLQQAALAYCAPRGIPLAVFLGRTVYPGEPQWLPDDTQAALDWLADQTGRCDGCGRLVSECQSNESEGAYRVEGVRCHACKAIHDEAEEFGKDGSLASMRWRLTYVEDDD